MKRKYRMKLSYIGCNGDPHFHIQERWMFVWESVTPNPLTLADAKKAMAMLSKLVDDGNQH